MNKKNKQFLFVAIVLFFILFIFGSVLWQAPEWLPFRVRNPVLHVRGRLLEQHLPKLKIGMSKESAIEIMGQPHAKSAEGDEELWTYGAFRQSYTNGCFVLTFEKDQLKYVWGWGWRITKQGREKYSLPLSYPKKSILL